jgi:hypothetical protein
VGAATTRHKTKSWGDGIKGHVLLEWPLEKQFLQRCLYQRKKDGKHVVSKMKYDRYDRAKADAGEESTSISKVNQVFGLH